MKAVAAALLGFVSAAPAAADDRDALWITSKLCILNERLTGLPLPCLSVDLTRGFAVVEAGSKHLLLVPTERIQGIEGRQLLDVDAPNYFEYAWESQRHLDKRLASRLSRNKLGLAVNSALDRTQDQLHIHVGCLRPDVRFALQVYETKITEKWSRLPFYFSGDPFRVMRVYGDMLGTANPFKLVAEGIPDARADMASQTIVVAGARFRDGRNGFYILTSHSAANGVATAEGLLDYTCSVLLSGQ